MAYLAKAGDLDHISLVTVPRYHYLLLLGFEIAPRAFSPWLLSLCSFPFLCCGEGEGKKEKEKN